MSTRNIEIFLRKVWSPYTVISLIFVELPEIFFDSLSDNHSLWLDEGKSRTNEIRDSKELHLLSEDTVITFLCFFKHLEMSIELFTSIKGKCIDTSKHLF